MKLSNGRLYRASPSGAIASVEHRIELSQKAGEYHNVTSEINGELVRRKVIGARGWERICRIAGVSFIKPAEAVQIERKDGSVAFVRIREMILGRSDNGNLRAIDLTLSYDVLGKLATDLFDRWCEDGSPGWGELTNAQKADTILKEDGSKGSVAVPGGNCLVYSLVDGSVRKLLREHAQWAFSADRAAATIVQRNLARRFFGFSDANEDGSVEFTSWVSEDVNYQSLKLDNGILNIGEKVQVESIEEVTLEQATEEGFVKDVRLADLIKAETRRLGGWQKARSLCKEVCDEHRIRWGDIGTTTNEKGLEAIYHCLKAL